MDQRRSLQSLSRFLLRQLRCRQFAKLVIHQRQQLIGGDWIAGLDLRQDVVTSDMRERIALSTRAYFIRYEF
jgi:hypothetical protein